MRYIGIDLGTSAVKLLLMEASGRIIKTVSREYPLYFPKPGWAEQRPEDWYQQTMDGMRELLDGTDASEVAGIGFGGQMHGLVLLDEGGEVIRPAILWNDGRTTEECRYLNETVGEEVLAEHTANIAFAGFTAPKILWMQKHEPENWKRVRHLMLPKDYLVYRLCGAFTTDYSDASGMLLLDVEHKRWSEKMISVCKLSPELLPELHESWEVAGELLPEIAGELGLSGQVKVTVGAGDNAAAAVGTGTVGQGGCNLSLGTSGTVFISGTHFMNPHTHAIHSFAHADGGWHLMGCILSAASCNKWWMDEICQTKDYDAEQKNITGLGQNSVFFLPYLMGERSPHNDASARGAFVGMSMDTTREDMTQAVLEGVAFAMRDSVEAARELGLQIGTSRICGGGAKSSLWCRILASVLTLTLEIPETEEGPGYGGAILAAVGCGEYPDVADACSRIVRTKARIAPEAELIALYEEKYQHFKKLYPALKGLFLSR